MQEHPTARHGRTRIVKQGSVLTICTFPHLLFECAACPELSVRLLTNLNKKGTT
jgi:hypothetical protein